MNIALRIAKIVLRITTGFAALLLLLVIALGLRWWLLPDEALDPAAIEFAATRSTPPTENNVSFLVWGFPASPELDAHAVGRRIVTEHDRLQAAQKSLAKFDPASSAFLGQKPLVFPADYKRICGPHEEHCLPVYLANAAEIQTRSVTYQVYLARYLKLREYEELGSAMARVSFESPAPQWRNILWISELVDAAIVQSMEVPEGRQAALEELAAEIRLWKRFLQANDWLVTQFVAVARLHHNYMLASDLMNRFPEVTVQYPELLQAITEPLLAGQTNLATSLRAEYANGFTLMSDPEQLREFFLARGHNIPSAYVRAGAYRPNATLNQYYRAFRSIVEFYTNNSPGALHAGNDAFVRQLRQTAQNHLVQFYEPGLNMVREVTDIDWLQYPLRVHHLIAQSRLLEIQRRLIAEQIPAGQVATMLTAWSPDLDDPFSEQPMHWDPDVRRLYYPLPEYMDFNKRWEIATSITLEQLQ